MSARENIDFDYKKNFIYLYINKKEKKTQCFYIENILINLFFLFI